MRPRLPLTLLVLALPAQAAGLNDTGISQCLNAVGTAYEACTDANSGDASPYPGQDGRFGHDAAGGALTKVGGGAAGFDFTALDASGNPTTPTSGATPHPCVRDNVTGLVWEVKTDDDGPRDKDNIYMLANDGWANAPLYANTINSSGGLCGYTDWRIPSRRELLSILHLGVVGPSIDTTYFPNTALGYYWSRDVFKLDPRYAWYVGFGSGDVYNYYQNYSVHVRLVRGGQ